MIYYQIQIETKENKDINELDKTDKEEVLRDVIVPYIKGEEFVFNGYFLTKSLVSRLKIVTTEKSVYELSKFENDAMPPGLIMYVSPEDIVTDDKYITDVTKKLLNEAKEITGKPEVVEEKPLKLLDKTKIFIVHGKDNEIKLEVARFVEKLGFEAIILHEQNSKGMTIIEKIENYANVGFCIVLYTPCDVGYEKNNDMEKMYRARQNVIFEHGYMIAKLGRNNVCALVKENVETPNDISGIVYVSIDKSGGWKLPLAREIKSSGYEVDFNLFV